MRRALAVALCLLSPMAARASDLRYFEDAALHYLEDRHVESTDDAVSLLVEDCATGERQCFRVDLATGETAPCD